ncbi:4056_t:CDS:2 [Paraglomus occultum]|uniref:4056_t:CDS:1 n=1 Tax=Paraglomus occultum TaxID=144539 RepID=A0A9N9G4E7_9GLOM|nr:4056_t:CDS:2 [Paraglomus occultum]
MITDDILETVLEAKSREPTTDFLDWPSMSIQLLAKETEFPTPDEITANLHACISSCVQSGSGPNSRFSKGILERPYHLALSEMINKCFANGGSFPEDVVNSQVYMLEGVNVARLKEIEQRMIAIHNSWASISPSLSEKLSTLEDFLFKFLTPKDVNTFLGLRTTVGSAVYLPPSLNECVNAFTKIHTKSKVIEQSGGEQGSGSEGSIGDGENKRRKIKVNTLTVGAKAFSKHCHRDRSKNFWGTCTGTEKQKNEQANLVLAKIITNAAWINLHSLPHNILTYEIRTAEGYGARWTLNAPLTSTNSSATQAPTPSSSKTSPSVFDSSHSPQTSLTFRGFLEPQMENGHGKKWIH